MSVRRVLVTGAGGFLGRACLDALRVDSWEVHAIAYDESEAVAGGVHWHLADLLDQGERRRVLEEVDASHLLHLAWTARRPVYEHLENFAWVAASLDLVAHFRRAGGERVLIAGSSAEYDWNSGICREGVTPLAENTAYGICKNRLSSLFAAYCARSGLSGVWPRLFFLYGPYENPARLVPAVITSLLRGETARCTHGRQIRDYLYSRDAAAALVHLLASEVTGEVNVASGEPVELRRLVGDVAALTGGEGRVEFGAVEAPADEAAEVTADVSRLLATGWRPRHSLRQGLAETVEWWRRQIKAES